MTNPIARSVVACDDWSSAVAKNPERNPLIRVLVVRSRIRVRAGHADALSHSVMSIIPRRKSHTHQMSMPRLIPEVSIVYRLELYVLYTISLKNTKNLSVFMSHVYVCTYIFVTLSYQDACYSLSHPSIPSTLYSSEIV